MIRWFAILIFSLALPCIAAADAIGPCPSGERVVTNPATPGSGHHGGFHCEPDPSASHCSVSHAPADGAFTGMSLAVALGLLFLRRS